MHLMENGIKIEGGDNLGKTIVFAKNTKHADFIVQQFDKNYPHLAGKFCRKIDYSVTYAQSLIDDFSVKGKDPQIVVSDDMLDTGIDVPEVVNLVFFKLVRSKTKFWQMLGRGTRLCMDLFAPGDDKKEFIIFVYCQNLEFFDANPGGYESGVQESVKQKVFKRRLELTVSLQDDQPDDEDLKALIEQFKDQMHGVVDVMNLDNFIVRKHRKNVETFAVRERWSGLGEDDVNVLAEKLSGLPSQDEDDEYSRRFDLLILNLQLAILQHNKAQANYQWKLREIAKGLENKSAIPGVATQIELIQKLQTDQCWQDMTLLKLEDVRSRLRDLVKYIDPDEGLQDVYTDFKDDLGESPAEYNFIKRDLNLKDYYSRVQRFLRERHDHLTIRRLRNNEPVSTTDIAALEDILFSEDGPIPREDYENIFSDKPLGVLVRSIVGLDRKAAKTVFADFLAEAPLLPDQISFLDEVVDYLVKNGVMEPKTMFETPFTHAHSKGIAGVFDNDNSIKVIELVRLVNNNAKAAS
jgi:type I restriction enzyme R subunit